MFFLQQESKYYLLIPLNIKSLSEKSIPGNWWFMPHNLFITSLRFVRNGFVFYTKKYVITYTVIPKMTPPWTEEMDQLSSMHISNIYVIYYLWDKLTHSWTLFVTIFVIFLHFFNLNIINFLVCSTFSNIKLTFFFFLWL